MNNNHTSKKWIYAIIVLGVLLVIVEIFEYSNGKYAQVPTSKIAVTVASLTPTNVSQQGQQPNINIQEQESQNVLTYKNEVQGYQFNYTLAWLILPMSGDAPFTMQYTDSSHNNNIYTVSLGFLSKQQLATMGISYCEASPNDKKRCETKQIGGVAASIDWGDTNNQSVFVKIPSPKGGVVTMTLQSNSPEAKSVFLPILNSFKFIK